MSHHNTETLKNIRKDYNEECCNMNGNKITVIFEGGPGSVGKGSRWRSPSTFAKGTVSALIKCPKGDTSGLCSSFYLCSDDNQQDEIDFEFLGDKKGMVQTNFFKKGNYNGNVCRHNLGFDASRDYHKYAITWDSTSIHWYVDDRSIRSATWQNPKPMYLHGSVWQPNQHFPDVADGWVGRYKASGKTFECKYKDVKVPIFYPIHRISHKIYR